MDYGFPEKYELYITISLCLITLIPLLYLLGHIFTSHGRGEIMSRPLLFIYFLFAPVYIYLFWFEHHILYDYLSLGPVGRIVVYSLTCFAVILKTDPPE
jgi:hypothetical protein